MNLLDQVRNIPHGAEVIWRWLGEGGAVCGQTEAQMRADICNGKNPTGKRCPNNDLGVSVTKPVALAVKQYLQVKNALSLKVQGEKQLGRCRICTCELRLLIHEPKEKVQREMADEEGDLLPYFCWKKL